MYSAEQQQIEICLLKSTLEEIENDLVVQRLALPELDTENEQQYRETMAALRIARSLNTETERLKQENVRLLAHRMQLKRQCEEMSRALEHARESRASHLANLHQTEHEEELIIRNYEDSLKEKSERFRKARIFYDEKEMQNEVEKIEKLNKELEESVNERKSRELELKEELRQLAPVVPDHVLDILGKSEMEQRLQEADAKCKALEEKMKALEYRN